MAILHDIRRPRNLDDAVRSGDSALNVLIMVLLIAFGLATWYFYVTPMADQNAGRSTISEPVTAPSPNPGP